MTIGAGNSAAVPGWLEEKMSPGGALRRPIHGHSVAVPDDPDPPRKYYGFKPKEFERANAPRPAPPEDEQTAAAPLSADAVRDTPIDLRELVRQGAASGPVLKGNAPANRANDVHAILRDNLARAEAAGLNQIAPPVPRPSRRKRDYWVLVIAGNTLFASVALMGRGSPVMFVSGIAGCAVITAGLTWVMWGVMDDY